MIEPATAPSDGAESPVLTRTADGVCTVTLNRPAAFNAFNEPMKADLLAALRRSADDDAVRAVVLTGSGRAFCAGQDLKEHGARLAAGDATVADTVQDFYNPLITLVTDLPKPVIASINGVAAGAGAALAFACDLRIAADTASFAMAFAAAGLSADSGASFTLPRLVGAGRAMQLMLLGETVGAAEALRIGLVSEVVPAAELAERAAALAARLAQGATGALGRIKRSAQYAATHTLAESLAFEDEAQRACFASADHREALAAFIDKRPPRFGGRD